MEILALVLSLVESLAIVVQNPALGLSGDGAKVARVLGLISTLAREGDEARAELQALNDQLLTIQANGAGIPPEVWDAWESRLDAAHARIQAARGG